MNAPKQYSLGPIPWTDDALVAAVSRSFEQAQEWVREHPGYDLYERLDSLQAVLRIFKRSARQFEKELDGFHHEARERNLFRRNRQQDLHEIEERFRELLYVFASSAMTLVDQARALSQKITLPDYDERVKAVFSTNPQHRFIQELRVDLIHVKLHKPGWKLTSGRAEEPTSKFMLWPRQLSRSAEYNLHARQFMQDHIAGIDLGRLIADYTAAVVEFHLWLHSATESSVGPTIADYQRSDKRIKAVSSRCWWNLIFQQIVIARKLDPYTYLDQYLTQAELAEVNALPHRSRRQVDLIIELVDEYDACDIELRSTVHTAFGTNVA